MVWVTYCQRSYVFEPILSYNEAYSPVYYYLFARRGLSFCVPWYIEFSSVSDNPWEKGIDTCSREMARATVKLEYIRVYSSPPFRFFIYDELDDSRPAHFYPRKNWREITRFPRENRSWKIYNAERSIPLESFERKKKYIYVYMYNINWTKMLENASHLHRCVTKM